MSITAVGIEQVVAELHAAGPGIMAAVEQEMARIVIGLQATIVTEKLEGQVLKSHTHHLARSITQQVMSDGKTVTGIVGVAREAPYGAVHEYGGTFTIPEHSSTSRLGNSFMVRAHDATFPARSFLRSTLAEQESSIIERLHAAAVNATK